MRTVPVLVAAAAMAASAPAMAQYFAGFEPGDWLGNWTHLSSTVTPHTLNADAARTGNFGAVMNGGGWWKHNEAVINDGDSMQYYFRGSGGRAYIGFTSDDLATEAYTVLAAPNTTNIIIQRNNGFSFSNLAQSTPVTWSASEFYRLDVSYSGGFITAQVFDSGGTALADAIVADTGYSGGGALFLRGFGGGHVDDISIIPAPGALALLGLGGLAATRRRR
jgi:hypothetical protein